MNKLGGDDEEINIGEELERRAEIKTYLDVMGLCCSSEVALIESILTSLEGVFEVSVILTSKTVIVLHDSLLTSPYDLAKALNQARLEATVRAKGETSYTVKWPSPCAIVCGLLLGLSFLCYVYPPFRWLAVAATAAGIWPILVRGVSAVKNLAMGDVNILVIIAVFGTLMLQDFLEAGTIVFLFTIAEWLQSCASHKANSVMAALMNIAPQQATLAETGELVNVEYVKPGTVLAIKTGEVIPIDGLVVEGSCEVDEKTLTGEAFPVSKEKDSRVFAGTININGYVSVKTSALSEDCVVAKMAKLVEEAQNNKPRFQRLIDKCAKYYTPAVVLVSVALAFIPFVMRAHHLHHWLHLALVVLVSACPCALILSTPVATFCALSKAASTGLLIKGGDYIETLAKVKIVAFDKTGTITRGEFIMSGFQCLTDDISPDTLLYWVSSIESKSSHPIADALVSHSKSRSLEPKPDCVEEFRNFPGEGVSGKIDDRELYVGNRKFGIRAGYLAGQQIEATAEDGRTIGYVYSGGALIGTFGLSDVCRSGAADAIRDLKSMGIRTAMLTGDSRAAATNAQGQLENGLDHIHSELLPEDKARIVDEYKRHGAIAMVGDGVNDAPALATADVGISMGISGCALATETGHVILMSNDVRRIPKAIRLAKRTRVKVIQNIIVSIATKVAVLGVAFAGHPMIWLAVLADVVTCLLVILNSMLLLRGSYKCHQNRSSSHHHEHHHNHGHKCSSLEENSASCASGKCCSKKAAEMSVHESSSQGCGSQAKEDCCKSSSATRDCEMVKDECLDDTVSSHQLSKPARRCHSDCCGTRLGYEHISHDHSNNKVEESCCSHGRTKQEKGHNGDSGSNARRVMAHSHKHTSTWMGNKEDVSNCESLRKESCQAHDHEGGLTEILTE